MTRVKRTEGRMDLLTSQFDSWEKENTFERIINEAVESVRMLAVYYKNKKDNVRTCKKYAFP